MSEPFKVAAGGRWQQLNNALERYRDDPGFGVQLEVVSIVGHMLTEAVAAEQTRCHSAAMSWANLECIASISPEVVARQIAIEIEKPEGTRARGEQP